MLYKVMFFLTIAFVDETHACDHLNNLKLPHVLLFNIISMFCQVVVNSESYMYFPTSRGSFPSIH